MFSYQHRYHAGNFADVHKHIVLIGLINHLKKKSTPFAVMDVHAGEGIYDLNSMDAQKTKEYEYGISKLINKTSPDLVQQYLNIVKAFNPSSDLQFYPGSSAIIASLIRDEDRGILIEGHPQAVYKLKSNLTRFRHIHIHHRDSFEACLALLPLKEKRGLIFLDPAYEVKTEYTTIVDLLAKAYQKFKTGIYALWYPILPENRHLLLIDNLKQLNLNHLQFEWSPYPKAPIGKLHGSGMLIINPPWQFEDEISKCFKYINFVPDHKSNLAINISGNQG